MGVVGLYPNIPHDEGLSTLKKRPNERDKKDVSTDTLVEKTLKQKRGTGIETRSIVWKKVAFRLLVS